MKPWLPILLLALASSAHAQTTVVTCPASTTPASAAAGPAVTVTCPATVVVPPPPPPPPPSIDKFFGMTVHHAGNVAAALAQTKISTFRGWDIGATWKDLQTGPNAFNWAPLQNYLNALPPGADFLYTFGFVPLFISSNPTGACTQGSTGTCYPPKDLASGNATFAGFVAGVVKLSLASKAAGHGYITHYELWNEPSANDTGGGNCPPGCGTWNGTMAQFLAMAKTEASVIHSLDPNAQLVGPGQSHCGDATDKINFMNAFFAGGGGALISAITCHAYYGIQNTAYSLIAAFNGIHASEAAHGVNLPVWFTEGDCEQSAAPSTCITDAQKVQYIGAQTIEKMALGAQRDIYYAWDGTHGDSLSGAALTAYNILQTWLNGSTGLKCSQNGPSNTLTTWVCSLTLANGQAAEILFLAQNGISAGTAATVPAGPFKHFQSLENSTVNAISGNAVSITSTPILLTQ